MIFFRKESFVVKQILEKELLLMKPFTLILLISFLILLTVSCTSDTVSDKTVSIDEKAQQSTLAQTESSDLREAIALAKQNKDYRLLVTSGRSMSVPGVNSSDYEALLALCGKKYNSATGDVIKSQEQRQERKKLIEFMRQYNEQMVDICQKNAK